MARSRNVCALILGERLKDLGLRRRRVGIFKSRVFFCLADYAVCMRVSERYDGSVGCGVLYCSWDDRNVP